jgi:hypothetical protein
VPGRQTEQAYYLFFRFTADIYKTYVCRRNRNLIYAGKLAIVVPVSSTLPKDGFQPALRERAFFSPFSGSPKKKPAIDTDAGFPVFSLPST